MDENKCILSMSHYKMLEKLMLTSFVQSCFCNYQTANDDYNKKTLQELTDDDEFAIKVLAKSICHTIKNDMTILLELEYKYNLGLLGYLE